MNNVRFGLIGAAGYVAPRHMRAIKETGNTLCVAYDPNDSVGVIDSFFPKADFFTEFERFDRHVDKERRAGRGLDYVSVCSPNYLHDAHTRFSLRSDANAICEKPLLLNPWNLDGLEELERDTGRRVYCVLQLRLHPSIIELKRRVEAEPNLTFNIDLSYVTSRGNWYLRSWKGDTAKSGGVATNIGVHFFDMLFYVFGQKKLSIVHLSDEQRCAGYLEFERARVRWFLSVNEQDLPDDVHAAGQRTYRSIKMNEQEIEFSSGFTDLHTVTYEKILEGNGFGVSESRPSIEIVSEIRHIKPVQSADGAHPAALRHLVRN